MSQKLNITERLEIPTEVLIRAINSLEIDKYTLVCGRCGMPMRCTTVTLSYEYGSAYSAEYHCTGACGNRLVPIPTSPTLGQFLARREV